MTNPLNPMTDVFFAVDGEAADVLLNEVFSQSRCLHDVDTALIHSEQKCLTGSVENNSQAFIKTTDRLFSLFHNLSLLFF